MDDDGIEKSDELIMEKQTTPDRLTRLPWDENETWEVIRQMCIVLTIDNPVFCLLIKMEQK